MADSGCWAKMCGCGAYEEDEASRGGVLGADEAPKASEEEVAGFRAARKAMKSSTGICSSEPSKLLSLESPVLALKSWLESSTGVCS